MTREAKAGAGALGAAGVVALALAISMHSPSGYPAGVLPDTSLTPGATLPVAAADVCVRGYAKSVRNVTSSEKSAIYREYKMDPNSKRHVPTEIDHLISLELGGSNDLKNLWPEPYDLNVNGKQIGAHEKDKIEDRLHAEVCAGHLTLEQAQSVIRTDWTKAYRQYLGDFPPYKPAEATNEKP